MASEKTVYADEARRLLLSPPHIGPDERRLVEEVFDSNWLAPAGPAISAFEQALADVTGIGHVAALSSGTAALHLALRLGGIGPGDEVWSATMTFIGGIAPVSYVGGRPVFLDVVADTMLLDLDLLEESLEIAKRMGTSPKAVITTDLYGLLPDHSRLAALKQRYGFVWISDSAESVGSRWNGKHAGTGADFVVLSFNGNKIITTSGGGALASDDGAMIEQARFLSTQAREAAPHYEHRVFGYNYRLSSVCAAIGSGQLRVLEERVAQRRQIHDWYREYLAGIDGISFSPDIEPGCSNRWLTTIMIDPERSGFNRVLAQSALDAAGVESRPVWKPMHMQPVFQDCRRIGGARAERAFANGLCLPSGSAMTHADVERVAGVLISLKTKT